MSTIKITYTEQDEVQVKKTYDVLMVWYDFDKVQVLAAMKQNTIALELQDDWEIELTQKVQVYRDWVVGESILVGTIRRYDSLLYTCIQAHTTQADWTPDIVPALFSRAFYEEEEFPDWVQPTGAHDAYNIGDKVTYNELHWESTIDANTWSPDAYPTGWNQLN